MAKASLSPRSLCSFSPPSDPPGRSVRYRTTPAPKERGRGSLGLWSQKTPSSFPFDSIKSHLGELLPVAHCIRERPVFRRDEVELRALRDAEGRVGFGEAHLRGRGLGGRGRRVGGLGRRGRRRRSSAGENIRGDDGDALGVAQRPTTTRGPMSTPGRSRPSRGSTAASWSGASSSRPAWLTGESGACTQTRGKERSSENGRKEEVHISLRRDESFLRGLRERRARRKRETLDQTLFPLSFFPLSLSSFFLVLTMMMTTSSRSLASSRGPACACASSSAAPAAPRLGGASAVALSWPRVAEVWRRHRHRRRRRRSRLLLLLSLSLLARRPSSFARWRSRRRPPLPTSPAGRRRYDGGGVF